MHRKNLRGKLERYRPEGEKEISDKARILDFLNLHGDCFERSLSVGHFTGSCWLENCDGMKFLMTLHRKTRFWLQLGGHADGDNDLVRVALREAHEESGLRNIELLSDEIFDVGVHLTPEYKGIPAHYHYDVRFLVKTTDRDDDIQASDESNDLKWFAEVSNSLLDISGDISRMFGKWKNYNRGKHI
ncbi:MAG: NUDIX hydrolase [Puniceicoccales bacterium]|jgi:8-oxo-dGTP pyrophosphatase MutT (NUDIX family)|nr:NUDIX hydrolase [Puniceicoccales bacterium]